MNRCKYCKKKSRGEYCSINCAGLDEKRYGLPSIIGKKTRYKLPKIRI